MPTWIYQRLISVCSLRGKKDLFILSLKSQYGQLSLSSSKRGNLLDSSFLGCSVLMLINLIDKFLHLSMLFEQDIQTDMRVLVLTVSIQEQVKRSVDGWSYFMEEQDQPLQASRE